RAGRALRAARAGRTLGTGRAERAGRADRTRGAGRTGRTLRTGGTLRAVERQVLPAGCGARRLGLRAAGPGTTAVGDGRDTRGDTVARTADARSVDREGRRGHEQGSGSASTQSRHASQGEDSLSPQYPYLLF